MRDSGTRVALTDIGTFAVEVDKYIFTHHDLKKVLTGSDSSITRFFTAHGGIIMYSRLNTKTGTPMKFVRDVVEKLVFLERSDPESVQERYTMDVCNAFTGLIHSKQLRRILMGGKDEAFEDQDFKSYLPAAAAAVGNINLLQKLAPEVADKFEIEEWFTPDILSAAVANNKLEVVEWMLQEMRTARTKLGVRRHNEITIGKALQIAVRKNHKEVGNMILDFLSAEPQIRPGDHRMQCVVSDCMTYGNVDLLDRILSYRKNRAPEFTQMAFENGLPMWAKEVDILFRKGTRSGLSTLLRNGTIDPNRIGRHLPLDRAVHRYRRDLAQVLLDDGANVQTKNREGRTALQCAVRRGYLPDVQFLIEHGADPSTVKEGWVDAIGLCQRAAAHTKGKMTDREGWRSFWETLEAVVERTHTFVGQL
jgi:hypothetical protein